MSGPRPSDKEIVREQLKVLFQHMLRRDVRKVVARAQTKPAAEAVMRSIWPRLLPADVIMIDQADPVFLRPQVQLDCGAVQEAAESFLLGKADKHFNRKGHFSGDPAPNKYGVGNSLKKEVTNFFGLPARQTEARRAVDQHLSATGGICEADARDVKTEVLKLLHQRLFRELANLGDEADENEAKRHLKILTALSAVRSTAENRREQIRRIVGGCTAHFPFVLKYHTRDEAPCIPSTSSTIPISLDCFDSILSSCIKEADAVRCCLENYMHRQGFLSRFLDAGAPITEPNGAAFERLADEPRQSRTGGVWASMSDQLTVNRTNAYRMPDGIICSVGLVAVLESVLKQIAFSLGERVGDYDRGSTLLPRVRRHSVLSSDTESALKLIFDDEDGRMALRDGLAHAAFVANDPDQLDSNLGVLTDAIKRITTDLRVAGKLDQMFGKKSWSAKNKLPITHEITFELQWWLNNLRWDVGTLSRQQHAIRVFNVLIPDKARLAKVAVLFWSDLEGGKSAKLQDTGGAEYAGILAGALALEELFRAVSEVHGLRVLKVTPDPNSLVLRTELVILDVKDGELLHEDRLSRIFSHLVHDEGFKASLAAVRVLRDQIIHGGWGMFEAPRVRYLHLIIKLLFELCDTIQLGQGDAPMPAPDLPPLARSSEDALQRYLDRKVNWCRGWLRVKGRRILRWWNGCQFLLFGKTTSV